MIISKLTGGLGNQMFQYAVGRRIAYINNTSLKIDITGYENQLGITKRTYLLHVFNAKEDFANSEEIDKLKKSNKIFINKYFLKFTKQKIPYYNQSYIQEKHYHFDKSILKIGDNVYLEGYWQSEKYFKDIENIIRKEIIFKKEPDEINKKTIDKITHSNSVSIHVRRSDYVYDKKTSEFHGFCDLDYYHKAVSTIAKRVEKPHFFIFSDDPLWVKQNLILKYPCDYINHNVGKKDYNDLKLMSNCHHNIIANSSFSWWGAWLNKNPKKTIIAPKKWFRNPKINTEDLIPQQWIRI